MNAMGFHWTTSQRGSAFVRGSAESCQGDRRAPRGVATGTNQERGDKMVAHNGSLVRGEGFWSLTGPCLKKVPRLDLDTSQRADPPSPQQNCLYLQNY